MRPFEIVPGQPVVLFLQDPNEKVWGILVSLDAVGVVVRGLDLTVFEEWMRQEARRDETMVGPVTLFYALHRVARMEVDETVGPVEGYSERFAREVGHTASQRLGLDPDAG